MDATPIGRVHSMEHFSTVDGPGIRFVLFLQGCPQRCAYCHNPDTWATDAGNDMSVSDAVAAALRYKPYFETSGGGVTVSGGEPLLQASFVAALFRTLKAEGVSTCLDTSGSILPESSPAVSEVLANTDLVLLDIKHSNPEAHLALTGFPLTLPLRFLSRLDAMRIPAIIRHVVIPGMTDAPAHLDALRAMLAPHACVEEIEMLPYHTLGDEKWHALGLTPPLAGIPEMGGAALEMLQKRMNHPGEA